MQTHTGNPYNVSVGQIWVNCDKRFSDVAVVVLLVRDDLGYAQVRVKKTGRLRRIRLDRFRERSNGYRLVSGVSE